MLPLPLGSRMAKTREWPALPWCLTLLLFLAGPLPPARAAAEPVLVLSTAFARFAIGAEGSLASVRCPSEGRECLAPAQPAPLLSLRLGGRLHTPTRAAWEATRGRLTLGFPSIQARAVVAVAAHPTHVSLELVELECPESVELMVWGPYPLNLRGRVGETVGVVRDATTAMGIQALNARTLGGYPTRENDIEEEFGADDPGDYQELPRELAKGQHFRGDTARPTEFGAVLQAFCRNRDRQRILGNWGHDRYVVPPFRDPGVLGSRIALFAVPESRALETLGQIEITEGLPHPTMDGVWTKMAPGASASYLIVDFGEDTIDRAIDMTRRAGLRHLYHSSPFETWGHFELKKSLFPRGREGLRACVQKARAAGVDIGVHTLSNFITPNDAYVTPTPDPRLARIGSDALAAPITADQTELPVQDPTFFQKATALNGVMIEQELVRYTRVSESAPWRLLECQRGAWGTRASAHAGGTPVGRLMDHAYNVFLTDAALSMEVARRIASLCNDTGIRQLSFDGLEGNWSTGMGQYGRTLFTASWYEALGSELQGRVINDASNPGHFNWHIYTRMNWGEPWYAGFRESQTLYRFKNQLYFERNLMPHMLGWFALRRETTLEDAEWLLARAAGFDAGFALATSLASTAQLAADPGSAETARQFGNTPEILEAIRHWETARQSQAFPPEVRSALRDNTREFHLTPAAPGAWTLQEVHTRRVAPPTNTVDAATRHLFRQTHPRQTVQWTLRNTTTNTVRGISLSLDDHPVFSTREVHIPAGGALRFRGGTQASLCDPTWRELDRVPVEPGALDLAEGEHEVRLGAADGLLAPLHLELRTLGPGRRIEAQSPHLPEAGSAP